MPDTPAKGVVLRANGREYGGWKRVRVSRGIEAAAGSFELELSERWSGQDKPWPILEEDECELAVNGVRLISGYVDGRSLSYAKDGHTLTVSGRDKAADLVDCSAVLKKWEFHNASLLTLAKRIAQPFGIAVSLQPGIETLKPVAKLSVDPGDTAFEALERACRMVGVLPLSDGAGGIVLSRAGTARASTELVQGQNILTASGQYDGTSRFRTYKVLGQHHGTDTISGAAAAHVLGTATDETVRREKRVLLLRAEGSVTASHAKRRAEWEATVRAARAFSVSVTVQGWTQTDGSLWPVNALVGVRSSFFGIDEDMLITEVTFALDDRAGTTTQIELKRPDAFLPEPVIQPGTAKAPWSELANFSTADGREVRR